MLEMEIDVWTEGMVELRQKYKDCAYEANEARLAYGVKKKSLARGD